MASYKKKTEYTMSYSDFRGVELGASGGDASRSRLEYCENLWRDYTHDSIGEIESIPGFRRIRAFGDRIHDIILHKIGDGKDFVIVHAGDSLYRFSVDKLEGEDTPRPIAKLANRKCTHFIFGKSIFFFTDSGFTEITESGEVKSSLIDDKSVYIPTLTLNGEMYEQRNLLTGKWKTRYILNDAAPYTCGTEGLCYKILDKDYRICAVSGFNSFYEGEVYIPSSTKINGIEYRVVEIGKRAFSLCTHVSAIHVAEGIEEIGEFAFNFCNRCKVITLPNSVKRIGIAAFENCQAMTDIYFGSGIEFFGSSQMVECKVLERIHYAGTEEMLSAIEGADFVERFEVSYLDAHNVSCLELPLARQADEVISVLENGEEIEFEQITDGEKVSAIRVLSDVAGKRTVEYMITSNEVDPRYSFGDGAREAEGRGSILECRVVEAFDNRIFLSGSPSLPNTVFFSAPVHASSENQLYFGELNYFNVGIGTYQNLAMLAVGDSIAIFKSGDDGTGSIFYHYAEDAENDYIPRVYKKTFVHSGISAVGDAISFMDDPVFLTKSGLYALAKKTINYDRNVVCRSHNVNRDLQKEDLSQALMLEWCGYLVIFTGTTAYLADSRSTFTHKSGVPEYEWFILKGVGSYSGGEEVYRFDSVDTEKSIAHPTPGEIFDGIPYSFADKDGTLHYYGTLGGVNYTIYPTSELRGGDISPVSAAAADGDMLYFGTEGGVLCKFNNDMRGVAPPDIRNAEGFDADEYKKDMENTLHPEYYSFDRHAVRYALKTVYDNCGIPHLAKSTVKHSLIIKCRCAYGTKLHVEVGTEGCDYKEIAEFPGGAFSFGELNFEALSLDTVDTHTVSIREKEKDWIEKQITVYTDGYASPIGIYAIAYRYRISGRVKNN